MFTGIVTATGAVTAIPTTADDIRHQFTAPADWLRGTKIGDSIAVNGACLTVTALPGAGEFHCDLSTETRRLCTPLRPRGRLNLEHPLSADGKFGGHIVTGHIDGTARITDKQQDDDGGITLTLAPPPQTLPLIAAKGSVALAGVSLTVNTVTESAFTVYLLPHTLANTTLSDYPQDGHINIETDIIARHIQRLLNK